VKAVLGSVSRFDTHDRVTVLRALQYDWSEPCRDSSRWVDGCEGRAVVTEVTELHHMLPSPSRSPTRARTHTLKRTHTHTHAHAHTEARVGQAGLNGSSRSRWAS
jgi:hypothetical protein